MTRLLHGSDFHLGHRRYSRNAPGGGNQREEDVARAFVATIDAALALKPDIALIAGDVFDVARPSNAAIYLACEQFRRLTDAGIPVIAVAGNHDENAYTATGQVLRLLKLVGVQIAVDRAKRFTVKGVGILAVPECAALTTPFEPDPTCERNVLLLHGAVKNTQQYYGTIEAEAIADPLWNYVALGDFHTHRRVIGNAWYSGSTEYVATDSWREARSGIPKGFVLHDISTGVHEFHEIPGIRPHVDLDPIYADRMSPEDVDREIAVRIEAVPGGIAGKVVRCTIHDINRSVVKTLDQRAIRRYKSAALHFNIDDKKPLVSESGTFRVMSPRERAEAAIDIAEAEEVHRELNAEEYEAMPVNLADYDDTALLQLAVSLESEPDPERVGVDGIRTVTPRKRTPRPYIELPGGYDDHSTVRDVEEVAA